jgi:cytochrome c oxidase accessory protein FixG
MSTPAPPPSPAPDTAKRRIPLDVVDAQGNSFYVSERKVYPRDVAGTLNRLRVAAVWWLLGMYYVFPWLKWDDRQAVLFDLPARKFYVFGLVFWPQDFLLLAVLLIIAAMALFFFTALAGRLWCGYACPQTVWTEVFLWMERWTEGDRSARIKLDAAPWSANKVMRKGGKHVLWALFALWTGFTFVGFFTPILDLGARLWPFAWGGWETFWVFFYALATWGFAGFLREQVCKYMCPYARFQSAMFDRDTLVITYDEERGEPRGARKRGTDARALGKGDCIDCTMCVQVCPTGIDIRKGLQIECIACAACIDVCDSVMDKMGSPRGLIRYTTTHALEHKPTHLLRPRTLIYGGILGTLIVGFVIAVALRSPVSLDVIRDRNALFRLTDDGNVDNVYTIRILNKSEREQMFTLAAHGSAPLTLIARQQVYSVPSGAVYSLPLRVRRPAYDAATMTALGPETIVFTVRSLDDPAVSIDTEARFLAPTR